MKILAKKRELNNGVITNAFEVLLSNIGVQGRIKADWGSLTYMYKKHTLNELSHIH